jgi:hypothetical protein
VPALDVEGVLRSLAKAAELVRSGGDRDLARAALFMEITLANVTSHLRRQDVRVEFVKRSYEEVPL